MSPHVLKDTLLPCFQIDMSQLRSSALIRQEYTCSTFRWNRLVVGCMPNMFETSAQDVRIRKLPLPPCQYSPSLNLLNLLYLRKGH